MTKKIMLSLCIVFLVIINCIIDLNLARYFLVLEKCFNKSIDVSQNLYALICVIIALISILIMIDILLVIKTRKNENKGIKLNPEERNLWNSKLDE